MTLTTKVLKKMPLEKKGSIVIYLKEDGFKQKFDSTLSEEEVKCSRGPGLKWFDNHSIIYLFIYLFLF
jgi:hypothetical protein